MQISTFAVIHSPIGSIRIDALDKGVQSIRFLDEKTEECAADTENPHIRDCIAQLQAYFAGNRKSFDSFGLAMLGTEFQQEVWDAAMTIPFGEKRTYAELAEQIGNADAARAVGNALNKNPLLLVVPCHRIVPASGGFGDFACGAWRKEWLLNFEEGHSS